MKPRFTVAATLLVSLLVFANVNIAQAKWPGIDRKPYGYAITHNWRGVQDVPFGEDVIVTAGTTDPAIQTVEFKWKRPDGSIFADTTGVPLSPTIPSNLPPQVAEYFAASENTTTVFFAQDTQTPDTLGDWGLVAIFHNWGTVHGKASDIVRIAHTSFFVMPEVPFGTIVILLSMFGTLGVFTLKRKHHSST